MKKYVVLDTEFTGTFQDGKYPQNTRGKKLCSEIIQIAAVALDEKLQVMDEFSMDVYPYACGFVTKEVQTLTGLSLKSLRKQGVHFKKAFQKFQEFVEGEDVKILTWDTADEAVLRENAEFWNMGFCNEGEFTDLQCIAGKMLFPGKGQKSVKHAVKELGLKVQGQLHNALSDVYNEVNILRQVPDLERAFDEYDLYYFRCMDLPNVKKKEVCCYDSAEELRRVMAREMICGMQQTGSRTVFPRFRHGRSYIKVWEAEMQYFVEVAKISGAKQQVFAYVRGIEKPEIEKYQRWYKLYTDDISAGCRYNSTY